ncbi:glycoside hydrolase [Fulvivirgaceae bacterium PWU4]|uniref:Glycoside hydrolase n=2 Tax=Chryseosolibacter histidini TaxID=2782349 RepID=A0AAP2GLQ8_9BACT|nr:glycoside hydrolase [Chryseosolibacter histidini]
MACLTPDPGDPVKREKPVDTIRIAWDRTTLQHLSPEDARYAGYARMIVLHDGSLFCVYECQGATHAIRSYDNAVSWTKSVIIAAPENEINRVVPEVLQLQDRSLLVSYNLRPGGNNTDPSKRFAIEVRRSVDGVRWSEPVRVYTAGHEFINGCWEPAQIQLPSGEIQLFIANEAPYTQSDEQEITLFRSKDNGASWTAGEKVSFRSGFRDGMPVPLQLKNGKEIIIAIEDNGIDGTFKPVIIRTPATGAWKNAPVLANSKDRSHALDTRNRVPTDAYAGAPYIRQLPSGETLLSYQSTEWRNNAPWDRSDMVVAIGDSEGRNFNYKSRPFNFSDSTKTCLWNSITVLNDTTVIALSSTNAFSDKTGVWMIKGYVQRPAHARR